MALISFKQNNTVVYDFQYVSFIDIMSNKNESRHNTIVIDI